MTSQIYEPQEDSYLLEKVVLEHIKPGMSVCDMGTGSGIQALAAYKNKAFVTAVDINEQAVAKVEQEEANITTIQSDLFENVPESFDCIIFNAPYLPNEEKDPDVALDGGKQGHELIAKFLEQAKSHLKYKGFVLLLFTTQTGLGEVMQAVTQNGFVTEELASESMFFEKMFVWKLTKTS